MLCVIFRNLPSWTDISSVDSEARFDNALTSYAITVNPRPCSAALTASIEALSASKLVCSAMPRITSDALLMVSLNELILATDFLHHQQLILMYWHLAYSHKLDCEFDLPSR